jgi:hypothetical protein
MKPTHFTRGLLAVAAFVGVASIAAAQPIPALRIVVNEAHYVFDGKVFDDLDDLERAVGAAAPSSLTLDACGPGSARALKGAAHRFGRLPLRLDVPGTDAASCTATARAVHVAQRIGPGPWGIDDAAVAAYWMRVMP